MTKSIKEKKDTEGKIFDVPKKLFQNDDEKHGTKEESKKGMAYAIATKEMANEALKLKKLNRSEDSEKESCGKT